MKWIRMNLIQLIAHIFSSNIASELRFQKSHQHSKIERLIFSSSQMALELTIITLIKQHMSKPKLKKTSTRILINSGTPTFLKKWNSRIDYRSIEKAQRIENK